MPVKDCRWCEENGVKATATYTVVVYTDEDGDETEDVCRTCADDFDAWQREEEQPSEGYDGPYFADTMSGGCAQL